MNYFDYGHVVKLQGGDKHRTYATTTTNRDNGRKRMMEQDVHTDEHDVVHTEAGGSRYDDGVGSDAKEAYVYCMAWMEKMVPHLLVNNRREQERWKKTE